MFMEMVMIKRIISLTLVLIICMSMTCIASAAVFTPSVENKGAPAVVELEDKNGNTAVARLNGGVPEDATFISGEFLVVTAVVDAKTSARIPDASKEALLDVYNGLQNGSITMPFEELDVEKADNLVIRDLFDVSWTDAGGSDFKDLLDAEDVSLEMTFEMDIVADKKVYVMVYKNNGWKQIKQVTNNGNGTITCVFEHLCPVAVIVEGSEAEGPAVAGDKSTKTNAGSGQNMMLWLGVAAAGSLAVFAVRKRRQK